MPPQLTWPTPLTVSVESPISFGGHYHTRDGRPSPPEGRSDPRATPIEAPARA
jgi:hypothetical protein